MKKYLILGLSLLISILCQAKNIYLESEFDIDLSYNNNILNLSEDDQDEYENNDKPEKYQIETMDDMITNLRYKLKAKNYWFGGHTQILSFSVDHEKYLKNEMLDETALSLGIDQYFSSDLKLELLYSYSPEIYVRQYKSVLDDEYHEYEYGRNGFKAELNWDILKNLTLSPRFDYVQLYFNEWFTEYDAENISGSIDAEYTFSKRLSAELSFARRFSDADAEDAFNDPQDISVIKDASYDANIYKIGIKIRKLPLRSSLSLGYGLYEKFYSSDYEDDDYHVDRNDYLHNIDAGLYIPVSKELKVRIHTQYSFRTTESPYEYVVEDKEYDTWKTGVTFSYDIKHTK